MSSRSHRVGTSITHRGKQAPAVVATGRRGVLAVALALAAAAGLAARPGVAHAVDAFLQGQLAGGRTGFSVADAGDVNNDGKPDLIVGAPMDNTLGVENGRAFLWLGGTRLTAAPRLVLAESQASQRPHFGWSVAGVGDVNNDGYDDVAVGAPGDDTVGADAGAVYIYFGGATASLNAVFDLKLTGETADDQFGYSVCKAGDLNGDTHPDFVVGAPYADPVAVGADAGAVYLFLGAAVTPSTSSVVRFQGAIAGDLFGWAVTDVPSFKGTGLPAILVGAPQNSQDGLNAGRAYLFFGGVSSTLPDITADVTFLGFQANALYGTSVSQAGRFNNDTLTDVLIGAPGYQGDTGVVRVFYGSATPAAQPAYDLQIVGETGGDRFGEAVADVGNHDGAGTQDIIVGAPLRNSGGAASGHVYLIPGGFSGSSASDPGIVDILPVNPTGAAIAGDHFGQAVSSAGDLDGDTRGDLIIGAPDANTTGAGVAGVAAIVTSSGGVLPAPTVRMTAQAASGGWLLLFDGPAAQASDASLWSVETWPRRLATLGAGLTPAGGQLRAELAAGTVAGIRVVELRWTAGGVAAAQQFALPELPAGRLTLLAPQPNPFNPSTVIRYELPAPAAYTLRVLDSRGRWVRTLARGQGGPGLLSVVFDGRDDLGRLLASGAYTVVLEDGGVRRTASAVLLK